MNKKALNIDYGGLARLYGVSIMLISYIQRGLWRKNPIPDSPIKDRGKG